MPDHQRNPSDACDAAERIREGQDACASGTERSGCPYPAGSEERAQWEEGWDQRQSGEAAR